MEEATLQYDVDPELLANFLDESEESVGTLDSLFVELEQRPKDTEIIDKIFRVAHSIKGLAAFLSLRSIKDLTHELETLLDCVRRGRLTVDSAIIDCLLAGFDELTRMLARVRAGKSEVEDEGRLGDVLARVKELSGSGPADGDRNASKNSQPDEKLDVARDDVIEQAVGAENERAGEPGPAAAGRTMRVSEENIDVFMHYVGDLIEMSESFNLLQERIKNTSDNKLTRDFKDINLSFNQLSDKLQKSLLQIRKVPARSLVQKIPRMVRDLANTLEKKVQVEVTGYEVQIDKSMIEALESPINHLVRNCVDHGIETPQERLQAGKDETGTVKIEISEHGDNVLLKIHDDGAGINPDKIREKAVAMRLATAEQAAAMGDEDVLQFIFHSGFSTAKRITDVSGRGVGMDVVRTNVESLRGTIEVKSEYGRGSTVTLNLPSSLTVLVVNGVLAGVGDQQYIIKLEDIHEAIRPRPEEVVTVGGKGECLHVRGRIYPLIRLHELFDVEPEFANPADAMVILAHTKSQCAGILVDRILGKQRAVVKELQSQFSDINTIAGTAILANTKVGMVLDIPGIIEESLVC